VGGANMIEHIECKNKIGADINEYLIAMWNALKSGYEPPINITKEQYLDVKNNIDKYPKELVAIVGFCATYNAGWFRRYGGRAVNKYGKVRNYYDEAIRNIKKQIPKILDVDFIHGDYRNIEYPNNSLVYCDIPYKNSSYEMYQENFNHSEFWEWVRKMSKNHIVIVSEYDAPKDFSCIFEKELTTSFDNKQTKKDTEKLFRINPISGYIHLD
jgi:DNA adenine methylase